MRRALAGMNADLHDARILVVDDEPANTVLLDRILRCVGYIDVTRDFYRD